MYAHTHTYTSYVDPQAIHLIHLSSIHVSTSVYPTCIRHPTAHPHPHLFLYVWYIVGHTEVSSSALGGYQLLYMNMTCEDCHMRTCVLSYAYLQTIIYMHTCRLLYVCLQTVMCMYTYMLSYVYIWHAGRQTAIFILADCYKYTCRLLCVYLQCLIPLYLVHMLVPELFHCNNSYRAKGSKFIQRGSKKIEAHARVLSQTFVHDNSKNEIK